jgi:hypothetical protein
MELGLSHSMLGGMSSGIMTSFVVVLLLWNWPMDAFDIEDDEYNIPIFAYSKSWNP